MKTLYYFRGVLITVSIYLIILYPLSVFSQNTYTLDLKDTSTYETTCGKIVPADWSVKNDSCCMYTPYLRKETGGCSSISYTFRINQSGNGEPNDNCYIQYQIDDGVWITDTILNASAYSAVHTLHGTIELCYGNMIQFRVITETDDKTEFWSIMDGNITVTGDFVMYPGRPLPLGELEDSMPVELTSFTAKIVGKTIELNWITASETNNQYFSVERTSDGKDFKTLFKISGAGTSNEAHYYSAFDYTPENGPVLYRLKQTDFDGKYTYSDMVYVNVNFEDLSYTVYPNPLSSNNTEISIAQAKKGTTEVSVYNENGAKVYEKIYCEDSDCVLKVNFDNYSNGTYILYIKSGDKEFKTKIVKTD